MHIVICEEIFAVWELEKLVSQLVTNTSWVCEYSSLFLNFLWSSTKAEKEDLKVSIENQRSKVVCVVILLSVEGMLAVYKCIKDNKIIKFL